MVPNAVMPIPTMPKSSPRMAIIAFSMVFLCGCLSGALAMTFWFHPGIHDSKARGMSMSVAEWNAELDLTEEQSRQLKSILDDFARYYENLLADGNTRVLQILTPEQRIKFTKLLKEHRVP